MKNDLIPRHVLRSWFSHDFHKNFWTILRYYDKILLCTGFFLIESVEIVQDFLHFQSQMLHVCQCYFTDLLIFRTIFTFLVVFLLLSSFLCFSKDNLRWPNSGWAITHSAPTPLNVVFFFLHKIFLQFCSWNFLS